MIVIKNFERFRRHDVIYDRAFKQCKTKAEKLAVVKELNPLLHIFKVETK